MFHSRSFCTSTRISLILLTAVIVGSPGCKGPGELSQLPVYSEAFQRTYFEAQNHLVKGDPESAYAGFMECLEQEPDESSLYFDLGKIDLELEHWNAALLHFDAANKLDSENRWYREFRAETNMRLERYEDVNTDLLWIMERRPGDFEWATEWTLRLADEGGLDAGKAWIVLSPQ